MAPSRLRCIPGGVDADAIGRAEPIDREPLNIHDDHPILLWVGRFDPVKGLGELISAFATVHSQRPAHLLLAGDGPYMHVVRRLVADASLAESVHLLGPRKDIARLLKTADLFVFPSYTEGMPNALLEAMAAGVPVVTTAVPGCQDLVTDSATGLLVPARDAAALANAALRLLHDTTLVKRLARQAQRHVREHFTLDRSVDRYAALYREAREECHVRVTI